MSTPGNAPDNSPDHAGVVAEHATTLFPTLYGNDPSAVPGHDHLVGIPRTGGDFNVPWHVYLEFFTPGATVTHVTTLAELQTTWADGNIARFQSGIGLDTGITFVGAVLSQATYLAGTPVS